MLLIRQIGHSCRHDFISPSILALLLFSLLFVRLAIFSFSFVWARRKKQSLSEQDKHDQHLSILIPEAFYHLYTKKKHQYKKKYPHRIERIYVGLLI